MEKNLQEIIIAYFNGGCATGSNNKKSFGEIKEDLKVILDFYRSTELDTEKE